MLLSGFTRAFLVLNIAACFTTIRGDNHVLNSPPTILVDRKWSVPYNTPIGTLVKRVQARDVENDTLEFGLEHSTGFNIVQSDPEPLPFFIDNKNGLIYTNESLEKRGGKNIFMFVTVTDGVQTSKNQVWVQIENATDISNSFNPNIGNLPPSSVPRFPDIRGTFPGNSGSAGKTVLTKMVEKVNNNGNNKTITKITTTATTIRDEQSGKDSPNDSTKTPPQSSMGMSEGNKKIIVTLIFTVSIAAVLSGIGVCLFRKRIWKKRGKLKKGMDMEKFPQEESMVLKNWRTRSAVALDSWDMSGTHTQTVPDGGSLDKISDKWEIQRQRVKIFYILGEGCFGQVWKCEIASNNDKDGVSGVAAVKMLKENASERERSDLWQELSIMKMLEPHQNVVRLLGCCTVDNGPLLVIMEYASMGKLQSYLRQSRAQRFYENMHGSSSTLTSRDLTSFCYQIAKGMQYLSSKGIVHRDLAARNVLVGENAICKVADFGFARDIMESHVYERKSQGRLPIRWMAVESLFDNLFTMQSDVWSFGILIWEIVTLGSTPYPGMSAAQVLKFVKEGRRLEKPEHCHRELYNIMYYCWDKNACDRPTFDTLVDMLEQLLLNETDYIELDRFPDHSYYNMISLSGEKL